MRRWWWLLPLLLIVGLGGFVIWATTPAGPMPEALTALQSDAAVGRQPSTLVPAEGRAIEAMSRLDPGKLHIRLAAGVAAEGPLTPRRYTLTHSDSTGELFLTIAPEVDQKQISGWYTRFMRDEVVAEWQEGEEGAALHVYCHVSGGLVFGSAGMRYDIFRRELPLVLEAFRFGDAGLFEARPELDQASIWIHFQSANRRYHRIERWGMPGEYRITEAPCD